MTEEFNGKFDDIQGILLQQQQTINNLTQIIIQKVLIILRVETIQKKIMIIWKMDYWGGNK